MDKIVDNWKTSQEMVEIRRIRRSRLCQALSLVGSAFLLIFGVLAIVNQQFIMGSILLISMCSSLYNVYLLQLKDNLEQSVLILTGVLFTLGLTLLYSGGINDTGILWIYPIFAINLFINRFWPAAYLSGAFILLSCILLFSPLSQYLQADYSQLVAIRFIITLIALYAMCLIALYSEEHAYDIIIKLHDDDIHRLAFYDSLTTLPNRWTFQNNLTSLLEDRNDNQKIALLCIDLDNFKYVNDNYGHEVGDALLAHFGKQLKQIIPVFGTQKTIPSNNEAFRLAGDEFIVILSDINSSEDAVMVAERILTLFDGGYNIEGHAYPVYASIGIAMCPDDTENASELLRYADAAMYEAKRSTTHFIEIFTREIADAIQQKQNIEKGLILALESNQFTLVYQPLFSSKTKDIIGFEALIRCQQPDLKEYGPDIFIPIAESTGLIKKLDEWILENTFKEFVEIREVTGFTGKCCINISGIELLDVNFDHKIKMLLAKYQLPSSFIELEITETTLVPDNPAVIEILDKLSEMGVSLSIDDFGTGYTSFNQLILYPANGLKIDRSFVNDLFSSNAKNGKMVSIIQNLATIYQLSVVAEGVETQEQFDYLQSIGCDYLQGHFLSAPLDKNRLITLLNNHPH